MYTSHIGKRFVQLYNERENTDLQPKQFFLEQVFPKFYNHPKYFKWVVNSPFVQALKKEEKATLFSFEEQQQFRLSKLQTKIETEEVDSCFAIGFPAANQEFDTSGQVSNIQIPKDEQEIYASWIGTGFGIEVEGKQVWLIDEPDVLWMIFEGWNNYRTFLNSPAMNLKGNEIDAWNTVWLDFNLTTERASPKFMVAEYAERSADEYSLKSMPWFEVLFLLATKFSSRRITLQSARYIFDKQKYVTLGFVQLELPEIYRFWKELFGDTTLEQRAALRKIYKTQFGVSAALERFSILGLRALEPKDLRKFMPESGALPKIKTDETSQLTYKTYIAWISAMLNNQQLLDLAQEAAQMLHGYTAKSKGAKTDRGNRVDELIGSPNRKRFIDVLTDIVNDDASVSDVANRLVRSLMTEIPLDNVPLFVTLVRFKYALPEAKV